MIEENTVARRALAATAESLGVRFCPDVEVANWDFMKKLVIKGMVFNLFLAFHSEIRVVAFKKIDRTRAL